VGRAKQYGEVAGYLARYNRSRESLLTVIPMSVPRGRKEVQFTRSQWKKSGGERFVLTYEH
jgi:hypothetical protein